MNTFRSTVRIFCNGSIALLCAVACAISASFLAPQPANAACTALPTNLGTTTFIVNVPASGTYRFWAHTYSPSGGNDAFYMQVDQSYCQIMVGDTGISANQFKWIDYQNGSTTNKINLSLSAGNHSFTLAGLDPSVGVDKIILAADTNCVPAGDGANCGTTSSGSGSIVTPPANAGGSSSTSAVTGTVALPGAANGSTVRYYLNDKLIEGSSLDTTKLADGKYILKRVETDATGKTTETTQEIVVDNHKTLLERIGQLLRNPFTWAGVALALLAGALFVIWRFKRNWLAAGRQWFLQTVLRKRFVQPAAPGRVVVFTSHNSRKNQWWRGLFVLSFALVGTATVFYAFAATQGSVSYHTWNGSVANGAKIVSKSDAIGGKMVQFAASAPTPPPSSPPPVPPPPTPPPAAACPNAKHTPGGPDGFGGCWPYAGNTGIPAGTVLTNYTGPCIITANNTVINAKTVNCTLDIRASNVQISNSKINGTVYIDKPNVGHSFTITDSEVNAGGITNSGIGKSNFTAIRVHVYGGYRSIWCENNCTVQDSWLHGQAHDPSGVAHESAVRMGDGSTIRHNSLLCDAPDYPPDAGCSANLTGYGDFAPIRNNTIERNLFHATPAGACAYGGSSGSGGTKPYGNQAENIIFKDNVFQRGPGGKCGFYFPISDFSSSRPGNQWINNKWDDGTILPPDN